jgi:glucose-6-phosphate 1-epimerase
MVNRRMLLEHHPLAGPVIHLTWQDNHAWVAIHGAQVVRWVHQGREMLWCASTRLPGKALRGGIPVCWPWFGPHPTNPTQPAHGVARLRDWEVVEQEASHARLTLRDGTLTAEMKVVLTNTLHLTLITHNHSPQSQRVTAAFHTYLAVEDIGQVRISGLNDITYVNQLNNDALEIQQGDVRIDQEIDRIYASGQATMIDGDRPVRVDSNGTSTVVWNPWVDKSARLGDMAVGNYRRMVCVETAWASHEAWDIPPGQSAILQTVLEPLA